MIEQFQKTNPLARGDKNIRPLEIYAEHAEIRKQVYGEIRKLYKIFSGIQLTILDKFVDCVTPLKNLHDPSRLPVYRTVPRSPCPKRECCIWALVSCLIQAYWEYELGEGNIHPDIQTENKEILQEYLVKLQIVNGHYPEMKIAGAEDKGYWLEL